jgi:predicted RNase H-related nuclease YkuK (DUF458 family)
MEQEDKKWHAGDGKPASWDEIIADLHTAYKMGSLVYVGSDSFKEQLYCAFVVTICIHNPGHGGRYYFCRFKQPSKLIKSMRMRLFQEAQEAISIALEITQAIPKLGVEVHLDVNKDKRHASGEVTDQVVGYAQAMGLKYKIKPDAWASSGIADKHTRNAFLSKRRPRVVDA